MVVTTPRPDRGYPPRRAQLLSRGRDQPRAKSDQDPAQMHGPATAAWRTGRSKMTGSPSMRKSKSGNPRSPARANTATTSAPPEAPKDKQLEAEPPLLEEWDLNGDTGPIPRLAGGTHGEARGGVYDIAKTDQRAANSRVELPVLSADRDMVPRRIRRRHDVEPAEERRLPSLIVRAQPHARAEILPGIQAQS
jgi:hypothetical protein